MNKVLRSFLLVCLVLGIVLLPTAIIAADKVVFLSASGTATNFFRQIAPEFEAETGIEVVVEDTPWPQYFEKITMELVAGTGCYNVVAIPGEWLIQLYPYLSPLDKSAVGVDDDFLPSLCMGYTIDDKLYGVPYMFNVLLGFYRTDLFAEAGVTLPKNWGEYVETLKTLKEKLGDKILAPGTLPLKRGSHNFVEFMQYLWSFGGTLLDENGKANLDTDAAYKALRFMYDQFYTWKLVPKGALELSYIESGELFTQGRVATTFEWPRRVKLVCDPEVSKVVGKWGVFARPGVSWLGPWGLTVPSGVSIGEKGAAYKFISWLTNKENMKRLALEGILVSRSSALSDPYVLEKSPHIEVALKSSEKGRTPPQIIGYEEIAQHIALQISEVMDNNKSIKEALHDTNVKINEILGN